MGARKTCDALRGAGAVAFDAWFRCAGELAHTAFRGGIAGKANVAQCEFNLIAQIVTVIARVAQNISCLPVQMRYLARESAVGLPTGRAPPRPARVTPSLFSRRLQPLRRHSLAPILDRPNESKWHRDRRLSGHDLALRDACSTADLARELRSYPRLRSELKPIVSSLPFHRPSEWQLRTPSMLAGNGRSTWSAKETDRSPAAW
jgi:hypothetical protein